GKTLISGGDDTTMLFWDVAAVTHRPMHVIGPESSECWESWWADLAGADASVAYQAIGKLSAAPQQSVAFLKDRLRPRSAADPKRVAQLLTDLDSTHFALRQTASKELEGLGKMVEANLRRALAHPNSSLESRRRLEELLDKLEIPAGERLRELRAV